MLAGANAFEQSIKLRVKQLYIKILTSNNKNRNIFIRQLFSIENIIKWHTMKMMTQNTTKIMMKKEMRNKVINAILF